jgi:aspartate carbamoyltransferase catalytic subunit
VTIIGDIAHSRVARSNIFGLVTLGARVTVCGPPTMIPPRLEELGVTVHTDLERAIEDADAVNVLRIQLERQKVNLFPSLAEYAVVYGINRERLAAMKPDCIIMHPGPINRGVEITQDVADGDRAVILEQVTNGVAVRMAVLYLICGEAQKETEIGRAGGRRKKSRVESELAGGKTA